MKRRCLKNGGRQKAFWGAVIPAVASLIGTGLSISAQQSAQEEAAEAQRQANLQNLKRQQMEQSSATINNYLTATSQEPDREYEYEKGGRRKLCNAGLRLTDGGPIVSSTGELTRNASISACLKQSRRGAILYKAVLSAFLVNNLFKTTNLYLHLLI